MSNLNNDLYPCKNNREVKIILAEDDLVHQKIIKKMLENKNWNVRIASNGIEVIDILLKEKADIILMDIYMPEMDGHETAKLVRTIEKLEDIPIIAITATKQEERFKYIDDCIDAYISKPVKADYLYQRIEDYLGIRNESYNMLNIDKVLENLDNSKELLKILIDDFISKEYENKVIKEIDNSIKNKEGEKLSKAAHKLKGTILYFQIEDIYKMAYRIELLGKEDNFKEAENIYKELTVKYYKLKKELEYFRNNSYGS